MRLASTFSRRSGKLLALGAIIFTARLLVPMPVLIGEANTVSACSAKIIIGGRKISRAELFTNVREKKENCATPDRSVLASRSSQKVRAGRFQTLRLFSHEPVKRGFALRTLSLLTLSLGPQTTASGSAQPRAQGEDRDKGDSRADAAANRINENQLVGLPLNGRSYTQLVTLQAGLSTPQSASGSRGVGGGSLTVSGGRSTSNNFLLDGISIMNAENEVPRSAAGVQLGSDAVLLVRVFGSSYGAEYGRGSGGVLNSITRSGTNEFHGAVFEYFRNSKLDARDFFDPSEPPSFKRNQFGFLRGGPVRRDRTFFMVNYEGMRDRETRTQIDVFPDALARRGIITGASGEVIRTVPVHETVEPYLDLYPLPNLGSLGGGVGEHSTPRFLPTDENFISFRVDHSISDRDSMFARYTLDDATSHSSLRQGSALFTTRIPSRQQYLNLVGNHIFRISSLMVLRFGFTRPVDATENIYSIAIPAALFFVPGASKFGQIQVPGISAFGPSSSDPTSTIMNTFQFAGDWISQKGPHALKWGFEVDRYRWDVSSARESGGVWAFNNLDSLLQAGPQETTNLTLALPGSDNTNGYRQSLMGLYVQEVYAVSPRLQLNIGLRHEFTTLIHEKDGKDVFLPDPLRDGEMRIGPMLARNPSPSGVASRAGFSWAATGDRRTVFRSGFGVYYDQVLEYMVDRAKTNPPFTSTAVRTNFKSAGLFPDAIPASAGVPLSVRPLDYDHIKSPMVLRYDFTLQQTLLGGWRLQASYVGSRGNRLFRGYERNLFPQAESRADGSLYLPPYEPGGPDNRLNPAFGSMEFFSSDAQSFYNSMQLSASKSFAESISIQTSYTYSKSVDDASSIVQGARQYGLRRTHDRALSDFDIRHRLSVNYFYLLPFGNQRRWLSTGLLAQLFGGWRMGGIIRYRTGTPFSPQVRIQTPGYLFSATRPNLVPGQSKNPRLGTRERYSTPPLTPSRPPELWATPAAIR